MRAPSGRSAAGAILYAERSFAELDREADAAGRLLLAAGAAPGVRVLVMVRPGLDLIRLVFALFKIGAVPVVIDPGMGLRAFLRCVRRSEPAVLLGIPPAIWLSRIFAGSFRGLRARVAVGRSFAGRLAAHLASAALPLAAGGADDLAAILFTSGSTGAPKGVCYQHGQFDNQVRMIRAAYAIEPGETDLPMLPIFALFNPALGMTTVVPEINPSRPATADPAKVVQAIRQNGVTNSFGSPVLWRKLADYLERTGTTLPGMRRVLIAGAPAPPELLRRLRQLLPGASIHSPYGATECLPVSSISADEVLDATWRLTEAGAGTCVGRPLPDIEVRILPVRDGPIERLAEHAPLPVGAIGEIVVTGPVVTTAYDRLPQANALAKIRDAHGRTWHRMGDLGHFDEQGRLWFCGRLAERVQTAAGTLYTDCCEAVFNSHPDVHRCALIGLGAAPRQTPAIVIETRGGPRPGLDVLRSIAAGHAHTRGIARFFFARSFPVDVRHNAKIHRLALARRFAKRRPPA